MRAKIFLNVTNRSLLDVTANLHRYEEKRNQQGTVMEDLYRGNIIVSITEKGPDGKAAYENGKKKYLSAFVSKETAKILFRSIAEDRFMERFGRDGIQCVAGSHTETGVVRTRVIRVRPIFNEEENRLTHFVYRIDEGEAKPNGKATPDVTVENWVSYVEALKMASEVLDYIRDSELHAMMAGKPLYTLMYGRDGKPQETISAAAGNSVPSPMKANEDTSRRDVDEPLQGIDLTALSNKELQLFLRKAEKSENEHIKQAYQQAVREAKKRMGDAL